MANLILCPKATGNTRKVCEAIASLPGWELRQIRGNESIDLSPYGSIILASGVYVGLPHKNSMDFINSMEKAQKTIRLHILFTWLGRGHSDKSAFAHIKKACEQKNIEIAQDYKTVFGQSFALIHQGHPTGEEIADCIAWAKDLV